MVPTLSARIKTVVHRAHIHDHRRRPHPPRGEVRRTPCAGWRDDLVADDRYVLTLQQRIEAARASVDPESRERATATEQVLRKWLGQVDVSRLRTSRSIQRDWSNRTVSKEGLEVVSGSFGLDVGISFEEYRRFRREVVGQVNALSE